MSHNSLRSQWAPPRLLFRVPPQASHLRRARERIRDYLGQYYDDDDLIHDLVLCIEEAATNAIRHSGADHDIEITLQFDDGRLVATVKDRGRGFDVSSFDPRRTPDPASDHGRGLFIISALTDSLELSLDGGVEVRMARRATPRAAPAQLESGLAEPRAMLQLEDRDARTRAMLDEVDEAFVALDWEYRYVHANRTALRMLGMSARQLYGHSLWEVFPQLSDTPLGEAFHAALELGRPSVTEHRSVVNGDWLEVRIYPTSVGVSVYYREINERKRLERERERAELQLLESREHERFLADVVEQAEAPFGVGAPDGRLIFCNAAFADLTGYSREELEQKAVTWAQDLTPVEWRATESALLAEAVAQRRAVRYEKEYLRKDGTRVPIELFVQPVFDESGELVHYRSFVTDISERKRAALERDRLASDIQAQSAALQIQSEELQTRTEELQVQNEELLAQHDVIVRENELRAGLNTISELLHSTLAADEVVGRTLAEAVRVLDVEAAAIELREGEAWPVRYAAGLPADEVGQPLLGEPVAARLAALAGKPLVIDEAARHESVGTFAERRGIRSLIAVPLLARDETFGTLLLVERRAIRHFDAAEIDFARRLGTTVGLALDNARLFEAELTARRREAERGGRLTVLKHVADAASSSLDPRAVATRIVEAVHRLVEPQQVQIRLIDEAGTALESVASFDPDGMLARLGAMPVDADTETALCFRTRERRVSEDIGATPVSETSRRNAHDAGIRAYVLLPITAGHETIGTFYLAWAETRRFDADELAFLEALAAESATGLEHARLFEAQQRAEEQARRELESTSLLLEVTTSAPSWTELGVAMEAIGDLLVKSTDHSRVLVELWDEEHREIEIAASRGAEATPRQRFSFDGLSEGVKRVIASRRTAVVDCAETQLPGTRKGSVDDHAFLLTLVVPVVRHERLVGLIVVDEPGTRRPFTQRDIELVEAIAVQAGAAIDHLRLLERDAQAARVAGSETWDRTSRLLRRLQAHRWRVLAAAVAIQSAVLALINDAHDTRHVLGLPGSMIALISVLAGALAGPLVGGLVAVAGGAVFYLTVGGRGASSAIVTTALSTAIWLAAGVLSGLLAKGLREQSERRRLAAIALAAADAAREVQLAEQARIEELATGLQLRTEELQAQGEELRRQSEETADRAALAEALNAIGAILYSTLDFDEIMDRALAQGVIALGVDAGTIELREADGWVVAHQHGFSDDEIGLRLGREQAPIALGALSSGRLLAIADLTLVPELVVGFPQAHGLRSGLAVPLIVRDEVIGCLMFWGREPRSLSASQLDFARQLGATVSLAIDNARLYLDQRRIAQTLQENFLHELPDVAGLELGTVIRTAHEPELVGGDFSDVFLVDDTHVVVLIGDVAGKGVRAAGLTETVRSTVRALAAVDPSPAYILGKTNELLLRFDADEPHVTAFLASLDHTTGHLSYASAGHPAPVRLGAFSCRPLTVSFGPPLGTFERPYTNAHAMLTLEDYLVLYTDGVTEARRGTELLGEERLLEIVAGLRGRTAQEVAEAVRDAALAHAGQLRDDLQVVVVRLA